MALICLSRSLLTCGLLNSFEVRLPSVFRDVYQTARDFLVRLDGLWGIQWSDLKARFLLSRRFLFLDDWNFWKPLRLLLGHAQDGDKPLFLPGKRAQDKVVGLSFPRVLSLALLLFDHLGELLLALFPPIEDSRA